MGLGKKSLPYFVVISALLVSLSAAFYSVTGIGKMFAGSAYQVMIMMGSLEIAKLVLASLLYQYWSKINNFLKTYYFIAIFILMVITSAGIYGYLSSAYSETSNKVEIVNKQVYVLDIKRSMFSTQLDDVRDEKSKLNDNIKELTTAISNNYIQYKDKEGNIINTTSSANRKVFESQILSSQKRRDDILLRETNLSDSIVSIDMKKLELETNADLAAEVGALKYISKLTGKSMDVVVNWFIVALMIVFDPLAVSLIVGANIVFKDKNKEKEDEELSKNIDSKIEGFKAKEEEFNLINIDIEKKIKDIEERKKEVSNIQNKIVNDSDSRDREIDEKIRINSEKENELKLKHDELVLERDVLEKIIENKKDSVGELQDLERIKKEISQWENVHWKMRRTPPPSAILD